MLSKIINAFPLWLGEVCAKDTSHCVLHFHHHQSNCVSVRGEKLLSMTEHTIWTRLGTVLGWSDPAFAHGSVAKVPRGVAPARTWRSCALR